MRSVISGLGRLFDEDGQDILLFRVIIDIDIAVRYAAVFDSQYRLVLSYLLFPSLCTFPFVYELTSGIYTSPHQKDRKLPVIKF